MLKSEKNPLLIAMEEYLNAGLEMDLEKLETIYAPNFENIRFDTSGRTINITKEQFMQRFRNMNDQGKKLDSIDDVEFLTTTIYDNHGSVIMRRIKDGSPVLYNFVWIMKDGLPFSLVREFTFVEDLSYLINMIHKSD
ncbi:hypothetical protein [Neobacillus massiliamazoniensis]|uniref:Nuclear transport factor 2 family protein n=1 Tax=Neobacillus massiliamazoniensis TaxID=1499688 RepID=A0A0U1NYW2_9BACI|nr:hypothetical protein [Neobacillus massiliamazoniensis]CRK83219.1 hypothetical protein BN000_03179 [Neobacillus massiliamazoniensis]